MHYLRYKYVYISVFVTYKSVYISMHKFATVLQPLSDNTIHQPHTRGERWFKGVLWQPEVFMLNCKTAFFHSLSQYRSCAIKRCSGKLYKLKCRLEQMKVSSRDEFSRLIYVPLWNNSAKTRSDIKDDKTIQ